MTIGIQTSTGVIPFDEWVKLLRDSFEVFLLHGFNDKTQGAKNCDNAAPRLKELGYSAVHTGELDYGYYNLLNVRKKRHPAVLNIAKVLNTVPKDKKILVIAYSNGCYYLMLALKYIFRKDIIVVLCSAALDKDYKFPPQIERGWVFYIKSDWTVWLASKIPGSRWGKMGKVGSLGNDRRFEPLPGIDYTDVAKRHGGMWKPGIVEQFVDHVDYLLTDYFRSQETEVEI